MYLDSGLSAVTTSLPQNGSGGQEVGDFAGAGRSAVCCVMAPHRLDNERNENVQPVTSEGM